MKNILIFVIAITHLFICVLAEKPVVVQDISILVPSARDLPQWYPVGEPEHVIGDDLFELINGGAEIYHEYGFKQVISQGFKNKDKKSFNLEIYEMQSSAAAYGVYTFKTSSQGRTIPVGTEGFLEEYYLNFWKGPFVVTIIGFDSEKETLEAILLAARKVNEKIKTENKKPDMVQLLPGKLEDQLKTNGIKYLKGNLGLFNSYEFDSANIFGIKECVMGDYQSFDLFILKYDNPDECEKWFKNGAKFLEKSLRFKNFLYQHEAFSVIDKKGKYVYVARSNYYLFIYVGAQKGAQAVVTSLRSTIK